MTAWFFVLVVVRKGHQFLLVKEQKPGFPWYLPAGKVEFGEDFFHAAKRETLEEGGIPIEIDGVLRIEHTPPPMEGGAMRVRIILVGRPVDETPPKHEPDAESIEAGWFAIEEAETLNLRGDDVLPMFRHVLDGGYIAPRSMITPEDAPWVD
ncbi:MAG: NUDIX domain-containing protein [Chloroflexota bacterium]